MSLDEQQENNISNFFASNKNFPLLFVNNFFPDKLAEQQDSVRPLNRNIGSLHTDRDPDNANISNFFASRNQR